ncbi:MAG: sulfotransferase [Bacteroidota bacterium]
MKIKSTIFRLVSRPIGFFLFTFFKKKKIVLIFSTIRSGSTLLKALLSEASDVSKLPEINFLRYNNKYSQYFLFMYALWRYDSFEKSIILIKRPVGIGFKGGYNKIDMDNIIPIFLIRNPMATYDSIMRMPTEYTKYYRDKEAFITYWLSTYEQLISLFPRLRYCKNNPILLRYEDLVADPVKVTKKIFDRVGSHQKSGVHTYSFPKKWEWKWGTDDGGEVIKSGKVESKLRNNFTGYDFDTNQLNRDRINNLSKYFKEILY